MEQNTSLASRIRKELLQELVSGIYQENTHKVVPVENCLIEDEQADAIIGTIRGMLRSFKIRTYDEDTGYGLLRHVLIRKGYATGEIMVVLVTASPVFPSKNNFVRALREKHPEITTIVQNINARSTSAVLGFSEKILYGKGYIVDELCGIRFRIAASSFYQINPVQTEILYRTAIEAAGLDGTRTVLDAYCGVGTIGLAAAPHAKHVLGVEKNGSAVRCAIQNAKDNGIQNARFLNEDATKAIQKMAARGEKVDVVFMDPPRAGSTPEFLDAVSRMSPEKLVYISCNPETQKRDLEILKKKGWGVRMIQPVDLFPHTEHIENIVVLGRKQ